MVVHLLPQERSLFGKLSALTIKVMIIKILMMMLVKVVMVITMIV